MFVVKHSAWCQLKENHQIHLPYQFHWRPQSVDRDPQLPLKKMKTQFPSNMSKSRRLTSTFFPIICFITKLPNMCHSRQFPENCASQYGSQDGQYNSYLRARNSTTWSSVHHFLCLSVRQSDHRPSIKPFFFLLFTGGYCITASAQVHGLPFLSLLLPTSIQLRQPCIQPCLIFQQMNYFCLLKFILQGQSNSF